MPHLTSNVSLSLGTGLWVLQSLCAKSMPASYPYRDSSTLLSGYVSITGRMPWHSNHSSKEDLGNQLATEGEAVKITNLFSSNISFVLNWSKKIKHSHGNSLQMASVLVVVINLSPVSQSGEAHVCGCLSEGSLPAEVLTGKRRKGQ